MAGGNEPNRSIALPNCGRDALRHSLKPKSLRRTRIGVRFNVAPLLVHDPAQFALHRFERVVDHLVERLV